MRRQRRGANPPDARAGPAGAGRAPGSSRGRVPVQGSRRPVAALPRPDQAPRTRRRKGLRFPGSRGRRPSRRSRTPLLQQPGPGPRDPCQAFPQDAPCIPPPEEAAAGADRLPEPRQPAETRPRRRALRLAVEEAGPPHGLPGEAGAARTAGASGPDRGLEAAGRRSGGPPEGAPARARKPQARRQQARTPSGAGRARPARAGRPPASARRKAAVHTAGGPGTGKPRRTASVEDRRRQQGWTQGRAGRGRQARPRPTRGGRSRQARRCSGRRKAAPPGNGRKDRRRPAQRRGVQNGRRAPEEARRRTPLPKPYPLTSEGALPPTRVDRDPAMQKGGRHPGCSTGQPPQSGSRARRSGLPAELGAPSGVPGQEPGMADGFPVLNEEQ